jgi:hypothetical protein
LLCVGVAAGARQRAERTNIRLEMICAGAKQNSDRGVP